MQPRSIRNWAAVLSLLAGISAVTTAVAQDAAATTDQKTEKKDESVKLEKFEVTGSRVKRLDMETPAPVVSYKATDIESKGYTNIGDFIQSLPFNTGAANSIYQTASFLRGAATTNLRGLGSNRFLVLVNGRRAITYALTNSGNRSVFDFNSLPTAAIDSIEFLKDGASAIYGSDAITGVMNIKLKKNFVGLSTMGMYGNTIGHDTGYKEISVVGGASSAKTHAMVAFDFKDSNSNFLHDYGISTTDYTQYYGTNKGSNQNSTLNWPANVSISTAQAAAINAALGRTAVSSGNWVVTGGSPIDNPAIGSFSKVSTIPNENRYNFAKVYQRYPAYDYTSVYTQLEHEFNEKVTAFGEIMFSDNNTYYAFTPGVINFSSEGLTLPANSPYNPFKVGMTTLLARTNFGPVRKFDTESVTGNFLGGLRGTVMDRWDWEVGAAYGFDEVTTVARNAIRATTYQSALNGTLTGFTGIFLNPFGNSNADLTKALFTISNGKNKSEALGLDAHVSGTLYTWDAGDIGLAAGVEARNDRLQTNPDTAAYLGSGGGQPLTGKRDVTSAYVELTAPLYKNASLGSAEAQLAGRYEKYSDFGNTTKPKIGLKVRLPENKFANVVLRGSYSESFQAPALGLLYASQTIGFSSSLLQDPLRPQDAPQQQRIITGGNPHLLPETAKTTYLGIVVDIPKVKELSFFVDYFRFRINQVIVTPSSTYLLSTAGMAQFPNGVVRDNSVGNPGPILYLQSVPQNNPAAYQIYKGLDMGADYRLRNTRYGDFQFHVEGTQILEIGSDSGLGGGYFNNTGLYNNPVWRGNALVSWKYKDFGASAAADYIGPYWNDGYTVAGWGENPYTLVSATLSYRGFPGIFRGTVVTLGANNLFDKLPPPNGRDTGGFDANTYGAGALGRFVYVRVRKDF